MAQVDEFTRSVSIDFANSYCAASLLGLTRASILVPLTRVVYLASKRDNSKPSSYS